MNARNTSVFSLKYWTAWNSLMSCIYLPQSCSVITLFYQSYQPLSNHSVSKQEVSLLTAIKLFWIYSHKNSSTNWNTKNRQCALLTFNSLSTTTSRYSVFCRTLFNKNKKPTLPVWMKTCHTYVFTLVIFWEHLACSRQSCMPQTIAVRPVEYDVRGCCPACRLRYARLLHVVQAEAPVPALCRRSCVGLLRVGVVEQTERLGKTWNETAWVNRLTEQDKENEEHTTLKNTRYYA